MVFFSSNNKGEYLWSQSSLEAITETGERSVRDFLAGKSPEALRCKGLTTGKSEKIAETKATIKPVPLVIVENYLLYHAFQGNSNARKVVGEFSGLGLYTFCHVAFGNKVDQNAVDLWNQARQLMREDFQPLLCKWHKHDIDKGYTTCPYAGFVQNFKRSSKIALVHPDSMDEKMLQRYDDNIKRYDLMRDLGLSDKEARQKLQERYAHV